MGIFSFSEKTCVRKLKQSNEKAFKQLFDFYYPKIVSYYYTRIQDKEQSEDLAQSVFIRLWKTRESVDSEKQFSSFIFTIARNQLIDFFRKSSEEMVELSDHLMPVYDILETEKISDQILVLLEQVNPQQRITFLLHRLDGLSYKEIAEHFNISVKAVEKRVSTVLTFLRKSLLTKETHL